MAAWPSPGLSACSLAPELTVALARLLDGPSQLFQTQDVMYTPPLPHCHTLQAVLGVPFL